MSRIAFTVNYEADQKRKPYKFVRQYCERLGLEPEGLVVERYTKFKNQFQARFELGLSLEAPEEIVYQMLVWANLLSESTRGNWTVNGPFLDETLSFECIFNGKGEGQPLKWAHIRTENED